MHLSPVGGYAHADLHAVWVVRGGSFLDVARLVRCAYSIRDAPGNRDRVKGFRVCVETLRVFRNP
jgi:formylglycine-generating enzyme required for sulfatase activity